MVPHWWNDKITLYNAYTDTSTGQAIIKWNKTQLDNCFYGRAEKQSISGLTLVSNDRIIARIPFSKNYRSPTNEIGIGFYSIPNDQIKNYFTLNVDDIIVNGWIDDNIPDRNSGAFITNNPLYRGRHFRVMSASDNTKLKNTAHYFASN